MHTGNINNPSTAAARVYAALCASVGLWIDGWTLTRATGVTAISTRVSEVRRQLPDGETIEHSPQPGPRYARGSWYRLMREPHQMCRLRSWPGCGESSECEDCIEYKEG